METACKHKNGSFLELVIDECQYSLDENELMWVGTSGTSMIYGYVLNCSDCGFRKTYKFNGKKPKHIQDLIKQCKNSKIED